MLAEAGDSFGNYRKGNVCRLKPLPNNGSEDVIVDTCVCVTVSFKVCMYVCMYVCI
jgi:hypothetical protein